MTLTTATRDSLHTETQTHKALGGVSRVRILELLRAAPGGLDAREVADRIGLHPNTVRVHLDLLIKAGLASREAEPRSEPGRPRILYRATAEAAEESAGYRLLAEVLAGYLAGSSADPTADAERAGRAWGAYLTERPAPFERLSDEEMLSRVERMLADLGFRPELAANTRGWRILLHRCPFREVAERHRQVVCSVHLGLIRGALSELGAPLEASGLDPFVEPSLCVAHVSGPDPAPRRRPRSRR